MSYNHCVLDSRPKTKIVVKNAANNHIFFDSYQGKQAVLSWVKGKAGFALVAKVDGKKNQSKHVACVRLNHPQDPELRFFGEVDETRFGFFGEMWGMEDQFRQQSLAKALTELPYPLDVHHNFLNTAYVEREWGDVVSLTCRGIHNLDCIHKLYGKEAVDATWLAVIDWVENCIKEECKKKGYDV